MENEPTAPPLEMFLDPETKQPLFRQKRDKLMPTPDQQLTPAELEALTAGEREIWERGAKWSREPTGEDDPTCAACGAAVAVDYPNDWDDGDWCWECWQKAGRAAVESNFTLLRTVAGLRIAAKRRIVPMLTAEGASLDIKAWAKEFLAALAAPPPATVEREWRADNAPVPCPAHLAPSPATPTESCPACGFSPLEREDHRDFCGRCGWAGSRMLDDEDDPPTRAGEELSK